MSAGYDWSQLNDAERELIKAAAEGREADLGKFPEPLIHAEVLKALCTGVVPAWTVKDGIWMRDGLVDGRLELSGAHLAHALRFTDCRFPSQVELELARADKPVEWKQGQLAAILANGFEVNGDLIIQDVGVTGLISLHWADIRGDLRLSGSTLAPPGGQALNGKDLRVGGSLFLDGDDFSAKGEVCLRSAHIEGQLDCRHAHFSNPLEKAINADHIVVDGDILLEDGFCSDGEVCLQWGKTGRLRATGGNFASAGTYALRADTLRAEAGIYLDRGFHATATVRVVGAYITGELCCTEGIFDNPGGRALDAERIVADDVYLDCGFRAHGDVRFNDAQITRQFNATRGEFRNERRGENEYALDCDGLRCGADVFLNGGFRARGAVSLRGAEIKNELNCTAGSFHNRDGYALFADGLTTPGTVFLDRGFQAIGEVRFARATVGRQFVCTNGVFDNEHGTALDATGLITPGDVLLNAADGASHGFRAMGKIELRNAVITRDLDFRGAWLRGEGGLDARGVHVGGCLTWIMTEPPEGPVDLSFAQVSRLDDTMRSWPAGKYTLAGMHYRTTPDGVMSADQRIKWLDKTSAYSADAYHELAESYRLHGDEASAEKALIACQRHLRTRGTTGWRSKLWNLFLGFTVGYGYRLHRVFVTLLVLWIISMILFYWGEHAQLIYAMNKSPKVVAPACIPGGPCFNAVTYSFQLLIPGLDLREATYWLPDATRAPWGGLLMIWTWIMIVIGWVAATAVVAGIARVFRRR